MKGCSMFVAVMLIAPASPLWAQAQSQSEARTTAALNHNPAPAQPGATTQELTTSAPAGGTSVAPAPAPAHNASGVPQGSTLLAEFANSLNAKKLKPGDRIKAILDQDLILGGKLVAKSESKLIGHVTEVRAHSKESPESRLGVVFDKILLKHHQELDFEAVVQALAPPAPRRSRVDEPDQMLPPPVLSAGNVNTIGRNSNSSSNSNRSTSSSSTLSSSVATMGQVAVVGSTPGMSPGNISTVQPAMLNNKPMSGGTGMHGVYGLKNLNLIASTDAGKQAAVIVSSKSDVKLESGTQIVLLVVSK
jgi:hypothetical protein